MFITYLLLVNILCAILLFFDYKIFCSNNSFDDEIFRKCRGIKCQWIFNVLITFGGAIGALIMYVILDPKINKYNLASRIYTFCWFMFWMFIIYIFFVDKKNIFLHKLELFINYNTIFLKYLFIINIITFITYIINSIFKNNVIKPKVAILFTILGGTLGAYLAMDFFNQKIHHNSEYDAIYKKFKFVPYLLVIEIVLFVFVIYRFY